MLIDSRLKQRLTFYGFQESDLIRKNLQVNVMACLLNSLNQYQVDSMEYNNIEDRLRDYIRNGI
jgi:hypothetical protein